MEIQSLQTDYTQPYNQQPTPSISNNISPANIFEQKSVETMHFLQEQIKEASEQQIKQDLLNAYVEVYKIFAENWSGSVKHHEINSDQYKEKYKQDTDLNKKNYKQDTDYRKEIYKQNTDYNKELLKNNKYINNQ